MSGFTEQSFLEAMRSYYLAIQNTTTTSNIDNLVKQLEAMQTKLDKTIEMINENFKKINDKVKVLQDDVKKLRNSL